MVTPLETLAVQIARPAGSRRRSAGPARRPRRAAPAAPRPTPAPIVDRDSRAEVVRTSTVTGTATASGSVHGRCVRSVVRSDGRIAGSDTAWTSRADFLIIGSGIAGLRAAASSSRVGRRAHPHQGRAAREQHRLRAGRHRRGGRARTIRRSCTRPTRSRPATACATSARCDVLVEDGPALRPRADGLGRALRSRRRRRAGARRRRRRTACGACCTPRDATGREIGRVLWQRMSAHARGSGRTRTREVVDLVIEDGRCTGVAISGRGRDDRRGAGAGGAARDRRRRAGLSRDDQPGGGHRRRHRDGVSRRRAGRRSRVRAVPSDGARAAGAAAVPAVRGAARRRRAAGQRGRRARS